MVLVWVNLQEDMAGGCDGMCSACVILDAWQGDGGGCGIGE